MRAQVYRSLRRGVGRVADVVSPKWHCADALASSIAATRGVEKSREILGSVALAAAGDEVNKTNKHGGGAVAEGSSIAREQTTSDE